MKASRDYLETHCGNRQWIWAVFLVALLLTIPPLHAQVDQGTITGTVTDPSGAAVGGATVSLVDPTTNTVRSTSANDEGQYIFANITPGSYTISATRTGFRATKIIAQDVKVGVTSTA